MLCDKTNVIHRMKLIFALCVVFLSGCGSLPSSKAIEAPAPKSTSAEGHSEERVERPAIYGFWIDSFPEDIVVYFHRYADTESENEYWLQGSPDLLSWYYLLQLSAPEDDARWWVGVAPLKGLTMPFFRVTTEPPPET